MPFLFERELTFLVVVLVLATSPVLTTLYKPPLVSMTCFQKAILFFISHHAPPSQTYLSLIFRHAGASLVADSGMSVQASSP